MELQEWRDKMALSIDFYVWPQMKEHEFGSFKYRVFEDYCYPGDDREVGVIFLHGTKCSCGGELDARDYANVLEHEYVELLCARIAYQDGYRKWNAQGFNKIASESKKLHG